MKKIEFETYHNAFNSASYVLSIKILDVKKISIKLIYASEGRQSKGVKKYEGMTEIETDKNSLFVVYWYNSDEFALSPLDTLAENLLENLGEAKMREILVNSEW